MKRRLMTFSASKKTRVWLYNYSPKLCLPARGQHGRIIYAEVDAEVVWGGAKVGVLV